MRSAVRTTGEADRVAGSAQLKGLSGVELSDSDGWRLVVGQVQEPVIGCPEQRDRRDVSTILVAGQFAAID